MTEGTRDVREQVARIVDPKAWKRFDANAAVYAKHVTEGQRRAWDEHFVADSLAKADAILALPLTEEGGLRRALEKAARTFRQYENLHRAKGTSDGYLKAEANAEMARECEAALSIGGGEEKASVAESAASPASGLTAGDAQRKSECRRCVGCEGEEHHWMYAGDADEAGEPIMSCKHCNATRPMGDGDE